MTALIITIILLAGIGVFYGGFVALIATTLTFIIGYFTNLYLSVFIVVSIVGAYEYYKWRNS